ncbi:MAG: hypothetical protein KJ621_21225 [Proteobacteria bacterium]|nr:hypothetical protein [Pseudomonadota bacterium]
MPLTELERSLIESVERMRKDMSQREVEWSKERSAIQEQIQAVDSKLNKLIRVLKTVSGESR